MKKVLRYAAVLILITGLLAVFQIQYAQDSKDVGSNQARKAQLQPYLKQIAAVLNNPVLSYDYSLKLYDNQGLSAIDSINGRLYKMNDQFCDSSNSSLSLLSGGYFCKIDDMHQTAIVCNMGKLQQQLGIQKEDINAGLISVTDSMLDAAGSLGMVEEGDYVEIKYVLDKKQNDLQTMLFRINKASQKIDRVVIIMNETPMQQEYSKELTIFNISNADVSASLSPAGYFTVTGGRVTLNNRYKGYKVKVVI